MTGGAGGAGLQGSPIAPSAVEFGTKSRPLTCPGPAGPREGQGGFGSAGPAPLTVVAPPAPETCDSPNNPPLNTKAGGRVTSHPEAGQQRAPGWTLVRTLPTLTWELVTHWEQLPGQCPRGPRCPGTPSNHRPQVEKGWMMPWAEGLLVLPQARAAAGRGARPHVTLEPCEVE